MFIYKKSMLSLCISISFILGCQTPDQALNQAISSSAEFDSNDALPYLNDWQPVNSKISKDPLIEAEIKAIVSLMTLEEKVGQMVQPDLREVTPAEAQKYKLGSILNGGGGFPDDDKYASAKRWANEADKFWLALEQSYEGRGFRIPFMWATDAVHGHNNVFGATLFPHNIGLGAARNPELIEKIGVATAREVAATGLDWTFAPTVATPRDYRWGRVYEGYSEDPEIVYQYAKRMVAGIQGGESGLKGDTHVISNVKHWIGDGGTLNGVDHGENRYTEEYLRNIHAMGYVGGLSSGAQVVMSSFNSWWNSNNYDPMSSDKANTSDQPYMSNQKIHGSEYLIADVLKGKMAFDGIVVTDWNGQGEINGCTAANCPQAVIAGNDVFMITAREDWQAFYHNVIEQVNSGVIPMSRIDDAVTRILRVKKRANLWNKPMPSLRSLAGKQEVLSAPEHVSLARQAVSESLVLLKNSDALPLSTNDRFLVVGSAANDITKQTGGWSLSWQGDGNTIEKDFPNAQTLLMAMKSVVGPDNVTTDRSNASPEDTTAIVVIGEDPYAEMFGDISRTQTLEFAKLKPSYKNDLETIRTLKSQGYKVVTIFYSGRPLYVNEEINLSDAFVAAWLPGTEGLGITDVLFASQGQDFKGTLSYSWGAKKCSTTINRNAPNIPNYQTPIDGTTGNLIEQDTTGEHQPLFPYGYGLNYKDQKEIKARYDDLDNIPLDPRDYGCGMSEPDNGIAQVALEVFGKDAKGEFTARMSGAANNWESLAVTKGTTSIGSLTTTGINYNGMQQSALNVKFLSSEESFNERPAAQLYMQTPDKKGADYNRYTNANSTLEFDIRMKTQAPESMTLATHCEWPCIGELQINRVLPDPSEQWTTVKVPLQCFEQAGMSFQRMSTPFLMFSEQSVEFDLGRVRIVPNSSGTPEDAVDCSEVLGSVDLNN
ncbi:1,4-B-D-glucan glucohydrolase [Vibrio coralliirubri]|nr:glycoside hydrolase family 3 N-terminal domain-containing protein [Vibrio coralliirubri]CDT12821.1 1,4-B-D-glucan glucohydrolase [Vibrio coralliirubri]CDT15632.1 1,4-B-D-glucan glucohydrolase [Vibrio coralliirubri]CDT74746.1 1,4-B-D-glucan glucohydrolase [Vibrio coralliirubri]